MDMPPTRFRVVEQGRRLTVIDTRAADASAAPATTRIGWKAALPTLPVTTKFDGSARIVTHLLYDAKGPREVTLDPGAARIVAATPRVLIGLAVAMIVAMVLMPSLLGLLVAVIAVAKPARERVTAWLDARVSDAT